MTRSSNDTSWAVAAVLGAAVVLGVALERRRGHRAALPQQARGATTILRDRIDVYDAWNDFESLPRYLGHVLSIEDLGDRRSRWVVRGPGGSEIAWTAEVTEDEPGSRLAWRSVEPKDLDHRGEIDFADAPGGRGTEVRVRMSYGGSRFRTVMAALTGDAPAQAIDADLRRMKAWLEAGEIPTNRGQPAARAVETTTKGKVLEHLVDAGRLIGQEATT
jgi:uncharacterized membrane protein